MALDERSMTVDLSQYDELIQECMSYRDSNSQDLGFEQIAICEIEIAQIKDRQASGKLRRGKKFQAELRLAHLEEKVTKLRRAHEEVAKTLRQKSQTLAVLPREMRDAIFEKIYVNDSTIKVTHSCYGERSLMNMPQDTSLYLSEMHVGPQLAQEAAEIFYTKNTFRFASKMSKADDWTDEDVDKWFLHDHYGSGVLPRDFVRSLEIQYPVSHLGDYDPFSFYYRDGPAMLKVRDHITFERIFENDERYSAVRERILSFRKFSTLTNMHITGCPHGYQMDTYLRVLNPIVRELSLQGIKITFDRQPEVLPDRGLWSASPTFSDSSDSSQSPDVPFDDNRDLFDDNRDLFDDNRDLFDDNRDLFAGLFDTPSDKDYAIFYAFTSHTTVFDDIPNRDLLDTWRLLTPSYGADESLDVYELEIVDPACVRVWLHEHYEVWKVYTREKEELDAIIELAREVKDLTPQKKKLRMKYYARLLEMYL